MAGVHEDFGEKIGGAKKDLWKDRGLYADDLEAMNEREAEKFVKKDNVWKKPDYAAMLEEGIPLGVVYFIKKARDGLNASPQYYRTDDTPEKRTARQKEYIKTVRELQTVLSDVRTVEDAMRAYDRFFVDNGYLEKVQGWVSGIHYRATKKGQDNPVITNKLSNTMLIRSAEYFERNFTQKAKKEQFCVSKEQKIPKGYAIHFNDGKHTYSKNEDWKPGTYYVTKGYSILRTNFETKEAALKWVQELAKGRNKNGKIRFVPPQLAHVKRTGPDYRNGVEITGQHYLDTFGFRGGEFGNWMNQNDRQTSLNMGFEALKDLASALKISDKDIAYGLNALSNNLIMANRKTLKNPNGLFLGTPGSGKSFSAKREIVNVFLLTEDDIIIADPENEYGPLVQQFGSQGQVIDISPTSTNYINPMDINLDYSDDENPITLKSDFILSLCDLIIGGKEGLSPIERTIIDRCTRLVYREYLQNPCPENMPILGDLYELLLKQSEPEAQNIATALEIYVNGSLNVFNHRSNIQMDQHRVLCFQLKSLGKALKEIGLLIMQDAVWNRVTANRSKHKTTWFYIDEFHLLLKGQTGSFSVEIWKRFRKWGGIPSGLTQNVKDLLASREIENIFENSDFIYMLNQAQGDRQILAKQLGISPHQLSYVTHSGPGEGLLFFGNVIIPFVDHFPKDTLLYSVLTTRPDEVAGTKA